ncbi:hypothetical protein EHV15_28830 [Paenibacillus oralis]|uniref:Uncharacterized protein n=1 Tax=Paenibacillus oralis TaxID=2490856 RepID=A0A3P3U8I9_9BACL|nr:hypothetical protein [Paenibacillus oralis]RRJ66484.1 hypothetical protein EHV15_28830 [Paenibacillus oralis]
MKKQGIMFGIIMLLAVIGIVDAVFVRRTLGLANIIVPVAILGVVFLLYKFPPRKYRKKQQPKIKPSARTMAKVAAEQRRSSSSERRKSYPFQVIDGHKGKNDDDLPKYH